MERLELAFRRRMRQLIWVNVDRVSLHCATIPASRDLISRMGLRRSSEPERLEKFAVYGMRHGAMFVLRL